MAPEAGPDPLQKYRCQLKKGPPTGALSLQRRKPQIQLPCCPGEAFTGTAEYPALVTGALASFYAELGSLHERMNQLAGHGFPKIEPAGWNGPLSLGPWMQVFAARQSIETQSAFDQTIAKLHIGIDGELKGLSRAPILLGLFAGLGGIDLDFEGSASETETDARLAGAYAAYNNGETYGQALVKYEHQRSTLRSAATDDDGAPYEVDVLGLSLEAGRHLAASDTLSFTPHARLTYAHAWAGSFEDASDITIDLSDSDSLRGELALRLDSLLWQQGTASLDAGVRREFLGEQQAVVSNQAFTHDLPGTSGFIAAHLDVDLIEDSPALGLHGEYAKGSDGEDFNGALSLKLKL